MSLITQLRRKGISLQKIRRVLKFLKKELGKGLYESVQNGHEVHLLTDGKNIYLEDDRRRIVDILNDCQSADDFGLRIGSNQAPLCAHRSEESREVGHPSHAGPIGSRFLGGLVHRKEGRGVGASTPGPSSRHNVDEDSGRRLRHLFFRPFRARLCVIPTPDRGFPSAALLWNYRWLPEYSCQRFGFT